MKFSYCCKKTHSIDGKDYSFEAEGDRFTCKVTNESHIKLFLANEAFKAVDARPAKVKKGRPAKSGTMASRSTGHPSIENIRVPRK